MKSTHIINQKDKGESFVLFQTNASQNFNIPSTNKVSWSWSIDRVGRFILGFIILGIALIILLGGVVWTILLILAGLNLIITSITNNCIFNKILCAFGFKEREEIYEPGGRLKK